MHELKLMDVQKNTKIKKQSENSIIHLQMVCMDCWEKMVRENNINEIDLWCLQPTGKHLLR